MNTPPKPESAETTEAAKRARRPATCYEALDAAVARRIKILEIDYRMENISRKQKRTQQAECRVLRDLIRSEFQAASVS